MEYTIGLSMVERLVFTSHFLWGTNKYMAAAQRQMAATCIPSVWNNPGKNDSNCHNPISLVKVPN